MKQLKQLHNEDLNLWLEEIAIAIKNRDFNNMDWDGLLEEIEDMTASQKRALRSYTKRLLEHILKLKYWTKEKKYNQKGWRKEVVNFRNEVKEILEDSPSLRNYLQENYAAWHRKSVNAMRQEFEIPDNNLIPLESILEEDYFGA
ncbi:MAG: DUF29 domain-containing protein [Xenococcus sp. (in: cyanobacteria)]